MKPFRLLMSIFLAGSFCAVISAQSPFTLDDCIKVALSTNPTIKVADMEIQRVDYSKKETIGALLPTISFGGTYNRMLAKQVMYMNMDKMGALGGGSGESGDTPDNGDTAPDGGSTTAGKGSNGIKMGLDNSYSLGFQASVPLIAPQLWKSLKLSDSQILQTIENARASRLSLINEVKNAYYTLLLAVDSRKVIQASYDMAKLTHEIYQKQFQAGAASDYDVLRTSVAMKNVEPDLVQSEIAIKQAKLQLLILMGMDADFPLEVAGELSDYEKTMYDDAMGLSRDYSANTQLKQNELQIQALNNALDVQKMAWLPTLSATANYNWTSMSQGNPLRNFRWSPYSMVGLTLSVPLFEGGSRYSKQKQAQIQVDEMKWQRENLERSVSSQVDLAIDNIMLNVKQIASTSESVNQADRAHDIMEKSFNIGAASYLDLRDSELALTQARLAYYQSIYNYLVANSSLELLLGNAPIEKYTDTSVLNR